MKDKRILFFNAQMNAMPLWKTPSDDPEQPQLVRIAAIQVDTDTRQILQSMNVIISPNKGAVIQDEVAEAIGLTQVQAINVGISEGLALDMFLALNHETDLRVAYNTTVNNRAIRIATMRYENDYEQDFWAGGEYHCVASAAKKAGAQCEGRTPTPEECLKFAHGDNETEWNYYHAGNTAMGMVIATESIYFAMIDKEGSTNAV